MKIQLKRSNVLENGSAKAPTAAQMEYGELAVNYNSTDPVVFIKDSSNGVIRLTNNQDVNDGQINVDAGEGLEASGSNATANQSGNTTRVLKVDDGWLTQFITNWAGAGSVNDGQINVDPGVGLTASGSNATANQQGNTTRTLSIDSTWLEFFIDAWAGNGGVEPANDGAINIAAGAGLTATGDNATANQAGNTTRTLTAYADPGYGIDVTASGLRFGDSWINIPALP